jgi:hypothetical protein
MFSRVARQTVGKITPIYGGFSGHGSDTAAEVGRGKVSSMSKMNENEPLDDQLGGEQKLYGGLVLYKHHYFMETLVNDCPVTFQLNSGASYTQIDLDWAIKKGFLSHPRLIGQSCIANGNQKNDLLCNVNLTILGKSAEIVVKIGPNQPCLFGCDALLMFDLVPDWRKRSFSISTSLHHDISVYGFAQLEWSRLLTMAKITESDLAKVTLDTIDFTNCVPKSEFRKSFRWNGFDLGITTASCDGGFDLGKS